MGHLSVEPAQSLPHFFGGAKGLLEHEARPGVGLRGRGTGGVDRLGVWSVSKFSNTSLTLSRSASRASPPCSQSNKSLLRKLLSSVMSLLASVASSMIIVLIRYNAVRPTERDGDVYVQQQGRD